MLGISKESWMAALEKENYLKAAEMSMMYSGKPSDKRHQCLKSSKKQCNDKTMFLINSFHIQTLTDRPVSYTHLDVYKRQVLHTVLVQGKSSPVLMSLLRHIYVIIFLPV